MSDWSVYLLRCADGSLYTGIATDVERRIEEHRAEDKKGAKYLRGRGPLELLLQQPVGERGLALRVEGRIKKLKRAEKERLVAGRGALARLVEAARGGDRGRGAPRVQPARATGSRGNGPCGRNK